MVIACRSCEKASLLASMVWDSSHKRAMRLPIPSPEMADVGTIEMYSRWFLFSWNKATFRLCKIKHKSTMIELCQQGADFLARSSYITRLRVCYIMYNQKFQTCDTSLLFSDNYNFNLTNVQLAMFYFSVFRCWWSSTIDHEE